MASIHKENPTQRQQIIMYLKDKGSMSAYEAFKDLYISQFWARVYELEARGWVFSRELVKYTNQYGISKNFKRIRILEEGTEI